MMVICERRGELDLTVSQIISLLVTLNDVVNPNKHTQAWPQRTRALSEQENAMLLSNHGLAVTTCCASRHHRSVIMHSRQCEMWVEKLDVEDQYLHFIHVLIKDLH